MKALLRHFGSFLKVIRVLKAKIFVGVLASAALVVLFQNCGQGFKTVSSSTLSSSALLANTPSSLNLAWDASTEPEVIGYTLKYGTQAGVHPNSINVPNGTSAVVPNLVKGQTYFFVVNSYSTTQTSPPSNEATTIAP